MSSAYTSVYTTCYVPSCCTALIIFTGSVTISFTLCCLFLKQINYIMHIIYIQKFLVNEFFALLFHWIPVGPQLACVGKLGRVPTGSQCPSSRLMHGLQPTLLHHWQTGSVGFACKLIWMPFPLDFCQVFPIVLYHFALQVAKPWQTQSFWQMQQSQIEQHRYI